MSNLSRKLELKIDAKEGPFLELDDWNHRDYIADVLSEHFELDYEFLGKDVDPERYTLYFLESTDIASIQKAIIEINIYHASSTELYEVI